ncbi:MAG: hypothetical protein M3R08_00805 [Bacteroidota bacterium]|nr:hypothetical protein [Bacteroidota bacterium]
MFVHPFLVQVGNVHYQLERSQVEMVDVTGQEKLAAFFQREPKVVLKRAIDTNSRICAGYLEDRLAVDRSMVIITPRSLEVDAMYILGLLNSKLYAFLYRHCFGMSYKGEVKRIKLMDLRRLPVPLQRPIEKGLINGRVIKILDAKAKDANSNTHSIEREIDLLVYRLFGISKPERVRIETDLAGNPHLLHDLDAEHKIEREIGLGLGPVVGEAAVEE